MKNRQRIELPSALVKAIADRASQVLVPGRSELNPGPLVAACDQMIAACRVRLVRHTHAETLKAPERALPGASLIAETGGEVTMLYLEPIHPIHDRAA
ncbi:hypothetical protein CKO28_04585 [Rhodovibrio sodomensis]|uniref:Uncharacterized protein n=1 Tax=Rhodovibrio sodomensis TaxID=1088 RepID=A0ABS1DD34_9PROT|nr:hypothetical protein [Rhodovibrio sodomensis]MBK1667310.1 hypothetical protein [Rhodovibrio sodomensis]